MASIRDRLLPKLDKVRRKVATLGFRRYHSVAIRRRSWSGGAVGLGTATPTDQTITPAPLVTIETQRVQDAAGAYDSVTYTISKITPRYTVPTTGGYSPSMLDVTVAAGVTNEDVVLVMTGDEGEIEAEIIGFDFSRGTRYTITARRVLSGPRD